jgi:hypothetical protein
MIIGTNLLGIVVRGIFPINKKVSEEKSVVIEPISSTSSIIITVILAIVSILYFFALYYYWNLGIMTAGLILMLTRLPDLLFEMKTGEKLNPQNMPKRPIDIICTILSWAALPLIWYSFCYFK